MRNVCSVADAVVSVISVWNDGLMICRDVGCQPILQLSIVL